MAAMAPLREVRQSQNPIVYTPRIHAASRTTEYLFHQLIPYIGNKRKLLGLIADATQRTGVTEGTFVDFFAGSGVVARFAKKYGYRVIANDWEPYAEAINRCHIQVNTLPPFDGLNGGEKVFQHLNALPPIDGYVTTHLCPANDDFPDPDTERLFFTRANGRKIDAVREQIQQWQEEGKLTPDEQAVLLATLIYSVSYVSNTSGVFKGFHRGWGGSTKTALYRILSPIRLRPPVFFDNRQINQATRLDAQELAAHLRDTHQPIDIAYLDPPYNQHPYGSNYHVLNTVTLWDNLPTPPRTAGRDKSAIRTDWRTERRSAYNHATAPAAYAQMLATIDARYILTSYSTDGNIALPDLLAAAAQRGKLTCVTRAYKRYRVSSQRMSRKPMNIEFVLVVDTQERATRGQASHVYEEIMRSEQQALDGHGKTAPP